LGGLGRERGWFHHSARERLNLSHLRRCDFGGRRFRRFFFGPRRQHTEVLPQLDGDILVNGTGVSLLLGNAELRQQLQDPVRLDLKFPRQLVDSDLTHKTR
jgi:hypothetical protein